MANQTTETKYLFVYGTLRKGVDVPINKKIGGDLEWVGVGTVKGYLYDIGNYPGALKENGKGIIKGDIFRLLNPTKTLEILDKYERSYVGDLVKSDYIRKEEMVELENEEKISASIYWYNKSVKEKHKIAGGDYLEYLKEKTGK